MNQKCYYRTHRCSPLLLVKNATHISLAIIRAQPIALGLGSTMLQKAFFVWSRQIFLQIKKEKNSERNVHLCRIVFFSCLCVHRDRLCIDANVSPVCSSTTAKRRIQTRPSFHGLCEFRVPRTYPISPRRARPWPWWLF